MLVIIFCIQKIYSQNWNVSTKIYGWTDSTRLEPHTTSPTDNRKILVKIFYPSSSGSTQFAQLGQLAPIIIFSPGGGCVYDQYTFLINDLVKNGYVVVAINHPYISGTCVFPGGPTINYSFNQLPDAIRAPLQAGDFSFCLDKVDALNANDPDNILTGKLDFSKIGAFGHSQGGIAQSYSMISENRIKAHIFHDGGSVLVPYPDNNFKYMNITAGNYSLQCDMMTQKLWYGVNENAFSIRLPSGDHMSYSGSTADAFRTAVSKYDLTFFNYCFRDSSLQDILVLGTTYPNNPFIYKPARIVETISSAIQWTQTTLEDLAVLSLHAKGNTMIAGTISGTMRTTNNGATWTQNIQGIEPFWETTNPFCIASNSTYLFAGYYDKAYRSTDDGITWTAMNLQLSNEFYTINALAVQNSNVFAGTSFGFFRSTNNGTNWTQITTGLNSTPNVTALLINNSDLFAGTNEGIFKSTDDGLTWTQMGLQGKQVSSIVAGNNRIFAATFNQGIYYSDDNGTNWTNLNFNNNNPIPVYSLMMHNNELYIASQGVHKYDANLNYASTYGLEDKYVCNLLVKDNFLFAGTNSDGVWQIPLASLTAIKETRPEENSIEIFPNPVKGILTLKYQQNFSTIFIYDISGKEVYAGNLQDKSTIIDVSNFPSGIYHITLKGNGFERTSKFIKN